MLFYLETFIRMAPATLITKINISVVAYNLLIRFIEVSFGVKRKIPNTSSTLVR
jgi:hypothetical protein